MPYKEGHPYHPPKNGTMPGLNKRQAKAKRDLAVEVQEQVPVPVIVEYWKRVAMGLPDVELAEDDDGDMYVTWSEDGGIKPTPERIDAAVRWLADRGHGLPAQSIHLAAHIRAHVAQLTTTADLGALQPSQVIALRRVLEGQRQALPQPASAGDDRASRVIDAESREIEPAADRAPAPARSDGDAGAE